MLLALSTGHRLQTFSLLKRSNIIKTRSGIAIKVPDLIKTSGPGKPQPLLELPYLKEKPNICVASTL